MNCASIQFCPCEALNVEPSLFSVYSNNFTFCESSITFRDLDSVITLTGIERVPYCDLREGDNGADMYLRLIWFGAVYCLFLLVLGFLTFNLDHHPGQLSKAWPPLDSLASYRTFNIRASELTIGCKNNSSVIFKVNPCTVTTRIWFSLTNYNCI